MNNFFVALFINNRVCQFKMDELIQNSFNGYINENFVFRKKNVYFPIQIQGEDYYLKSKSVAWKIRYENEEVREERKLQHGDYFVFSKEDLTYAALILDYQFLQLSAVAYQMGNDNVFIGRAEEMNIVIDLNANISRKCAAIRCDENGKHHLEDLSGKTGIYVNGIRCTSKELVSGDEIYIMGITMIYFPGMIIVPSAVKVNGMKLCDEQEVLSPDIAEESSSYVRTPRIIKSQESGKITIDAPPAPQKSKEIPFILTAGPSMTMSLAMLASLGTGIAGAVNGNGISSLITSGVMTISMLAGALLWPSLLRSYNKRQEEANEKYRRKKYTDYLIEKEKEIKRKYERNQRVLNENLMPSPELLTEFIEERSRRLWERVPSDSDFLAIRLGVGEAEFGIEIQAPRKGFSLEEDPMIDEAVSLKSKYERIKNVPIALSLAEKKVVGVVGESFDILKVMITNIIALHSSDEVKIVLVYNATDIQKMQWANDLPHVWSGDRKQRYVATNQEEAKVLFSNLDEIIQEREEALQKVPHHIPRYVVMVMDEQLVEDVPFRRYLTNADNTVGVSTVFFGKRFNHIPKECTVVIQKDAEVCGVYVKNENDNRFINFLADEISDELVTRIATGIKKIPVKTEKGKQSVPDRVTFLDMYRVGNVDALEILNHWATNISEKSLAAPIGIKAGGEIFSLDIHEKFHGCHGLVAGTTGSGKSEFLQAYILSMMINYSPSEVAFVLVDFKGGDMARPFLKSPHLAATISNLSGNTLYRALISLEAEVRNRQNLFNKSAEQLGVDKIDINSYHKYFKDKKLELPLPHLVIVIDEFAQLKSQHPEFMTKLVDIAQVGRSLGIHLILATQRPSGVVDPQIWSNSKFKVCLKVLDKQDSMDMISHPDAALFKQPGRAYVQVGYDEIFEQIQSGYSGADYVEQEHYVDEESVSVSMMNWPAEKIRTTKEARKSRKSERTQLEEIVSVIVQTGETIGARVKQLWLPPLPKELLLESCLDRNLAYNKENWDKEMFGCTVCGMADIPERQEQRQYGIDFIKNGHLAIYGSAGTGKSSLIQTILFAMALKYSPEWMNVFVLDFDGNSLANVRSMPHCGGYASDGDDKGIESLFSTIQGIIEERRNKFAKKHCANYESYITSTQEKMPMILLVLDNYAAFRERMYRSEDMLVQMVSAARSCGIYLIVTGNSKGAIYYKVIEQISEKIVLNMNDTGAYRDILNVAVPIIPEQAKGRGLTVIDKKVVEVQFAVPFDAVNESERTSRIHQIYETMSMETERAEYAHQEYSGNPTTNHVMTEVQIYETKMETLESVSNMTSSIVIGTDITTGEAKGFSLTDFPRVFIGTMGMKNMHVRFANDLARKESKQIYLVTSKVTNGMEYSVEAVSDLDGFIEELSVAPEEVLENVVLIIDDFCDFYDRISDEALSVFERMLVNKKKFCILTLDEMSRLEPYRDTGLYVHLIRTDCGAIVKGRIDDAVAAAISTEIYNVPRKFRERELQEEQALVYHGGKIAYVNIEGS